MRSETEQGLDDVVAQEVREALVRYWIKLGFGDEAQDLAQEGVVKGLRVMDRWEGRSSLKTFLITVGKNAGLDYLRRQAKHGHLRERITTLLNQVFYSRRHTPARAVD